MNKEQLISEMSRISGLTKTASNEALDAMMTIAKRTLYQGERIQYRNAGTFTVTTRAERKGRNFRTGEEISIKSRKVVKFRANCPGPR